MEFFNSAIGTLQTLVIALGAGLGVWGVINLLEGYGNDNPGAKDGFFITIKNDIVFRLSIYYTHRQRLLHTIHLSNFLRVLL